VGSTGYFVQPTVFSGVSNKMRIAREEIFGPVLSIIPFVDEADAVLNVKSLPIATPFRGQYRPPGGVKNLGG
jgi:acyl-CoA reductase-like NAD-dependent aldehyde dehydrogenase